jgi:3-oxoadipate enol-lactonase
MPTAAVNGIDLYFEESGSGPPLLLIAGISGNTLGWSTLAPTLAQYFHVIAFDNRGAGRSSAPEGPYTISEMGGDAAALLDHLGIDRAHVVGLSMGGMIAQELALAHSERIDRLVLLSTAARSRPAIMGPWLNLWVRKVDGDMEEDELALAMLPWMFTPALLSDHDQLEAVIAEWVQDPFPAPATGLKAQVSACRTHDSLDRLPQITAPTLVLVGPEDILTPVSYATELAEAIPGARLHVLERGGHIAEAECPDEVADTLLMFLRA